MDERSTNIVVAEKELAYESPMLTVEEAAFYLRIAVSTLRHWVSDHRIPFVKYNRTGSVRFRKRDLDKFIAQSVDKGMEDGSRGDPEK